MASSFLRRTALEAAPPASPRRRVQSNGDIHSKGPEELDMTDENGLQGGQNWNTPTTTPTLGPTTSPTPAPTSSPTAAPTRGGLQWLVRGEAWYDRNGNGVRDSNVAVAEMGADVERTHGLGGVSLQLVQCEPTTGRAYEPPAGETLDSFAGGRTKGVDALGKALIVPMKDVNGKFGIHLAQGHGLDRHYYLQAQVPSNAESPYLFTSGICNDNVNGWGCDYPGQPATLAANATIEVLGISEGRSEGCIFVDRYGDVDRLINFGVMRMGDMRTVNTDIALVLDFDDATSGRRLAEVLARATVLDARDDGHVATTTRYLLADRDKAAIGTVTAEVLAAALDVRLASNGVELDSVNPKDVIFSRNDDGTAAGGGGQLAVAMSIRGHYSPPPDLDFDYIVQDSINQDTTAIRRGLREFNRNCRAQTSKVRDEGFGEEDFNAVVSTSGAKHGKPKDLATMDNVFSTACSTDFLVPEYFETSLKEVGARDAKEPFKGLDMVYVAKEDAGLLADWAVGPVAGLAGLIVLLAGLFVFRRALGPRRAAFSDRTKDVDGDEMRRFGEEGGAADDGSVGSAFYSDSDSDLDETEKERRMRRKNKANEQRSTSSTYSDKVQAKVDGDNVKPQRKSRASKRTLVSSFTSSMTKKGGRRGAYRKEAGKRLDVSHGSDDSSEDEKKAYRGDSRKRGDKANGNDDKPRRNGASRRTLVASVKKSFTSSMTKKSARKGTRSEEGKLLATSQGSDSTDTSEDLSSCGGDDDRKPAAKKERSERRARRGRSTRDGGDNANAYDDSKVV